MVQSSSQRKVKMSETKLDVFKVEYNWYKDVSAIAVGILLADVVKLVFQAAIFFLFIRH